jgi:hypothetical protein
VTPYGSTLQATGTDLPTEHPQKREPPRK